MLHFKSPGCSYDLFYLSISYKASERQKVSVLIFSILLYVLTHNTHSWYEINLSRCEGYNLSIPLYVLLTILIFLQVFVCLLRPCGSLADESFIKGYSIGNTCGLPWLWRNAPLRAERSRAFHPRYYGSPNAIIPEQVIRHYHTSQGRYGETGTVPSFIVPVLF